MDGIDVDGVDVRAVVGEEGCERSSDDLGSTKFAFCSIVTEIMEESTHRLIIVTVLPYARSPYFNIVLYTPMCSRHFTIASGVHGRMDLTNPGGGSSESAGSVAAGCCVTAERREEGSMKRMLQSTC